MRELLDFIPFLDIIIVGLLLLFLYVGWVQGVPRLVMFLGAVYTGFLLASVYYHLFAVVLGGVFNSRVTFITDIIAFLILDVLVTVLMVALLLTVFGHIEIRGRAAIFDKVGGAVIGLLSGVLLLGILVTILRVPVEGNKQKLNATRDAPALAFFNDGYNKSALAPQFVKAAPILLWSVAPLLPQETQTKGAVPLLASVLSQK